MSDELPRIEIRPAHVWTCEECGIDNFEHCVVVEMDEEDRAEMADQMGVDPEDIKHGDWVSSPDEVECKGCGAQFVTRDMRIGEDDDDDSDDN